MFTRKKRKDGYVLAKDYVPSYVAFQNCGREMSDLHKKICEQISHLTYERKKEAKDKIRTDLHVPKAKQLLEAEIKKFVQSLPAR
jgi:hypothetical protein